MLAFVFIMFCEIYRSDIRLFYHRPYCDGFRFYFVKFSFKLFSRTRTSQLAYISRAYRSYLVKIIDYTILHTA